MLTLYVELRIPYSSGLRRSHFVRKFSNKAAETYHSSKTECAKTPVACRNFGEEKHGNSTS
jgi:hypothetical protein